MSGLLAGKVGSSPGCVTAIVRAWAIARALGAAGARLAVSYRQPRWERRVRALAETLPNALVVRRDATQDDEVERTFARIDREFGGLDFIVHSIAGAPYDALHGRFVATTRADWHATMETNAYSLLAMARAAEPLFRRRGGGSVVAIRYYGSEKAVLGYKVMGVAKAALAAIVRGSSRRVRGPERARQRHIRWRHAYAVGQRHTRIHPTVSDCSQEDAAALQHRHVGRWRHRGLPRERPRPGRDGGDHPRGRWLPRGQELVRGWGAYRHRGYRGRDCAGDPHRSSSV